MDREQAAHARPAQRDPTGVHLGTFGQEAHQPADLRDGARAQVTLGFAVAAIVERQRDEALAGRDPREVGVVLLARPGAVQDEHRRPLARCRSAARAGKRIRRRRPSRLAPGPYSIICGGRIWPQPPSVTPIRSARGSTSQGHLEIGGCDVVELAERFGTPAYIYAEDDMRARARAYLEAFAARTDDFEVIYGSKAAPDHRHLPADERGGAVDRRRLGRRAPPGASSRRRARADLHAREQQDRARAAARVRRRHRLPGARLVRRDRARRSPARPPAGGPDQGDARNQAVDSQLRPDRPDRLEVRLRPRGRARERGRASACRRRAT